MWKSRWSWSMVAVLCSSPFQNTRNVWQRGAERPIFFAWCSRLFCDKSTNKNMAWEWLSWWWGCYQVVQWIWKMEASETRRREKVTDGCWYQIICFKIIWGCKNHCLFIKFDPCQGPRLLMNMSLFANVPRWIWEIPEHLKTQEMCDDAVEIEPHSLAFVPERF